MLIIDSAADQTTRGRGACDAVCSTNKNADCYDCAQDNKQLAVRDFSIAGACAVVTPPSFYYSFSPNDMQ